MLTKESCRLFVLETRNPSQPLVIPFPSSTRPPPTEDVGPFVKTSEAFSPPITGFELAAQASAMLDEVLAITRNRVHPAPIEEVARIDAAVQSFLIVVLEQCDGTWATPCGTIAIIIR